MKYLWTGIICLMFMGCKKVDNVSFSRNDTCKTYNITLTKNGVIYADVLRKVGIQDSTCVMISAYMVLSSTDIIQLHVTGVWKDAVYEIFTITEAN